VLDSSALNQTQANPENLPADDLLETYPLELGQATLEFDWTVVDKQTGAVITSGITKDTLTRSAGGFLADYGAAARNLPTPSQAIKLMSSALADQLVEELGPAFSAADLAAADDSLSKQALALAHKEQWDEAAAIWTELTRLNPQYHPALYNLGLYYEKKGQLETAWSYYRQAFLSHSSNVHRDALTRLTDSLNRLNRLPGND
jgi:tetratricopeptide (TPR) repeat protein